MTTPPRPYRPSPSMAPAYARNVGRPAVALAWTDALLPAELLMLAWGVPLAILAFMAPIGVALGGAVWLGRLWF